MAIQGISPQTEAAKPRFNPALVKPVTFQVPQLTFKPFDQVQLSEESSQEEAASGHLGALVGNFGEQDGPEGTEPAGIETDLRSGVKDWFPVYAAYLDVNSLETA